MNNKECFIVNWCKCKTAVCYSYGPDEGCWLYKSFKKIIEQNEKENEMKNYEERKELTYKYLDKIPWDRVLDSYCYIEDIFENISTEYSDELELPKEFHGDVFNFIDIKDFINYLEERNICNIDEEIKVMPYISKINYEYIEDLKKQNE